VSRRQLTLTREQWEELVDLVLDAKNENNLAYENGYLSSSEAAAYADRCDRMVELLDAASVVEDQ